MTVLALEQYAAPLWAKVVQTDCTVSGKCGNALIRLLASETSEQWHGSEYSRICVTSAAAVKAVKLKVPRPSKH